MLVFVFMGAVGLILWYTWKILDQQPTFRSIDQRYNQNRCPNCRPPAIRTQPERSDRPPGPPPPPPAPSNVFVDRGGI